MSARTETLGAGSHGVRLWYGAIIALMLLIAAVVVSAPRNATEPIARPNAAVQVPVEGISPAASAAERAAVREPFVPAHGAGDFRGTAKGTSDEPAPWPKIASDPKMFGSVFCASCG